MAPISPTADLQPPAGFRLIFTATTHVPLPHMLHTQAGRVRRIVRLGDHAQHEREVCGDGQRFEGRAPGLGDGGGQHDLRDARSSR